MNIGNLPYIGNSSVLNAYVTNAVLPACRITSGQSSQAGVQFFFGFSEKLATELQWVQFFMF